MPTKETVIEKILALSYDLKEGALFAIEIEPQKYHSYYQHEKQISYEKDAPISILNEADVLIIKALASLDGATIIKANGEVAGFCATLTNSANYAGHGKRHAFALGTSRITGVVCILASEEDHKIRVFKEGLCVSEFDMETKKPVKFEHKLIKFLTSPVSGSVVGASLAASVLTLNPIPAIIAIAGSSVLVSQGFHRIREFFGI